MEPVKYKLQVPIKFGTEEITEFEIRVAKTKDMRAMPTDPKLDDLLNLAGKLSGQPKSVIDEMSIEDMHKVMEIVGNFISPGPKTGNPV